MRRTAAALISLLLLALLCAALTLYLLTLRKQDEASASFFSAALRQAGASATVLVFGRRYGVVNGNVVAQDAAPVTLRERLQALEVAYALVLARRSPILGVPGVDPELLRKAARQLDDTAETLAADQKNPADASAVSTALYPTAFLRALAETEARRQSFLASGSSQDEHAYASALENALREERLAQGRFSAVFDDFASVEPFKFPGAGGTISTESARTALYAIAQGIDQNEERFSLQNACLRGEVSACAPTDLAAPAVPVIRQASPPPPPQVSDIQRLFAQAYGRSGRHIHAITALDDSQCLSALPPPYYVIPALRSKAGKRTFAISYRGDLYLRPTQGTGPVNVYQARTLDISYSPVNPLIFYLCPQVGKDIGTLYAVEDIADFAKSHPSLAPAERSRLFARADVVYEHDAAAYLAAAMRSIQTSPTPFTPAAQAKLEELVLEYQYQTAGLGVLVDDIAQVDAGDSRLRGRGVPFDLSAKTLFLTHSAFPSLLPSPAPYAIALPDPAGTAAFFASVRPYRQIPREELLLDLKGYLRMEGRIVDHSASASACAGVFCQAQSYLNELANWYDSSLSSAD